MREGEGSQRRSEGARRKTGERDGGRRFIGATGRHDGGADEGGAYGKPWGRAVLTGDSRTAMGKQGEGNVMSVEGAARPPRRSQQQRRRLTKGAPPTAMTAPDVLFGTLPRFAPP